MESIYKVDKVYEKVINDDLPGAQQHEHVCGAR